MRGRVFAAGNAPHPPAAPSPRAPGEGCVNRLNCLVSVVHLILTRGSYTSNALAFATAFTATAALILGIVVLIRARAALAGALFCATSASCAGWLGSFAL